MGGACVPGRGRLRLLVGVAVLVGLAPARAADPPGTAASRDAVRQCHAAAKQPPAERAAWLDRAVAAAEVAIAADDGDALAHFALFCALGERTRLDGVSLRALATLRRLRAAVDRTLALAPEFADALAGKGAFLLDTPRLLGGDPVEGERLLRRALEVDPDYLGPRFDLVRALRARGARAEARTHAETALRVAERKRSPDDVATAQGLLATLAE